MRRPRLVWLALAFACRPEPTVVAPSDAPVGEDEWGPPTDVLVPRDDGWIEATLRASDLGFGSLLDDSASHRLQLVVTEIRPGPDGPRLRTHGYRVEAEYTYPASAIKTFASVVALRELERLQADGVPVDVDTPLAYCIEDEPCEVTPDPDNLEGGVVTLREEIREMQLVSDNLAFNYLYDFVGHERLNRELAAIGFPDVRIHHRMYDPPDPQLRVSSPRVELRPPGGPAVVIPARVSALALGPNAAQAMSIGSARVEEGARVEGPLDFSHKNHASVLQLHRLTLALGYGHPDLGLSRAHLDLLRDAMSTDPLASRNPRYTDPERSELRYKALLPGIVRVLPREQVRYLGKAGRAYGFHLDNALIENVENGCAVAVTATIYANANGVLNDDVYEYEELTRPFLNDLGEALARAALVRCGSGAGEG